MDKLPPNNYAFNDMITDPIQTKQKTIPKISLAAYPKVPFDKVQDKDMHNTKGPHKSQFFSFLFSPKGIITILTLLNIYFISLIKLKKTDSSKVYNFYYLKFYSILKLLLLATGDSLIYIIISLLFKTSNLTLLS